MNTATTYERTFRRALGSFATGVTVVSGLNDGMAMGATVNSFSSVSLDPRLVLFSLAKRAPCLTCFGVGHPFAISVLSAQQQEIACHFAVSQDDKWARVQHTTSALKCPVVPGAIATFEGVVDSRYAAGDHIVVFGHVERFDSDPEAHPLVYLRGQFARLTGEV